MNLRPSGYEPDELPGCSTPRQDIGAVIRCPKMFCGQPGIFGLRVLDPFGSAGDAWAAPRCQHRVHESVQVLGMDFIVEERFYYLRFAGLAATYSPTP